MSKIIVACFFLGHGVYTLIYIKTTTTSYVESKSRGNVKRELNVPLNRHR